MKANNPLFRGLASLALCAFASAAAAASAADSGLRPGPEAFIAHQGESRDAPGNTLPAFELAVERGFGFECDVTISRDGRIFLFHDDALTRITGGADKRRCEDVPWEEIERLDVAVGKWKDTRFAGTHPPLLSEALALARDGRRIYLDVKPRQGIVEGMREVIAAQTNATPENTVFICFDEATCQEIRREMPGWMVLWISFARGRVGQLHKPPTPPITPEEILETLRRTGADGVDMQFDPELHDAAFVRAVHDAGYGFHVWTVNDPALARLAIARGVDSVTTDAPGTMLAALDH